MDNIVEFNKQLKDFIKKLILIVPKYEMLKDYYFAFDAPIMFNKSLYIKNFYNGIKEDDFDTHILNKNEELFLKYNFSLNSILGNFDSKINEIKKIWLDLNPKFQEIIWKYLIVLVQLSKNYHCN